LSFRSLVAERDSMATLTEQLREAIETAGVTRYEIAKQTGVGQAALSKFVLGQRGLSNKAMDAVGEYLGLAICKQRKPRKKQGG
jgi:cyanate lyase